MTRKQHRAVSTARAAYCTMQQDKQQTPSNTTWLENIEAMLTNSCKNTWRFIETNKKINYCNRTRRRVIEFRKDILRKTKNCEGLFCVPICLCPMHPTQQGADVTFHTHSESRSCSQEWHHEIKNRNKIPILILFRWAGDFSLDSYIFIVRRKKKLVTNRLLA